MELEAQADEYQSSVCFFVFKAPLTKLHSLEEVEKVVRLALEMEERVPLSMVLQMAEEEKQIQVSKRDASPFR